MSVSVKMPQVDVLRREVEKIAGEPLRTHNAFVNLVGRIESAQNDHISESTLERMWGYSTRGCEQVSLRTLDVLARFAGAESWEGFCEVLRLNSVRESEEIMGGVFVDAASLEAGVRVRIGWQPDRIVEVECLGLTRFRVVSSENSSMKPGDCFSCIGFRKGHELYLEKYVHKGSSRSSCYVVGQNHGLTDVEVL